MPPKKRKLKKADAPAGVLLNMRVLKAFPYETMQGKLISALFLGTVVKFCPCSSNTSPKPAKKRRGEQALEKGLYRVHFDDGDVDDMDPDEILRCILLYHEQRQLHQGGSGGKNKTPILGSTGDKKTAEKRGLKSLLSKENRPLSSKEMERLDEERWDYWTQYRLYNIKNKIPQPTSFSEDHEKFWWNVEEDKVQQTAKDDEAKAGKSETAMKASGTKVAPVAEETTAQKTVKDPSVVPQTLTAAKGSSAIGTSTEIKAKTNGASARTVNDDRAEEPRKGSSLQNQDSTRNLEKKSDKPPPPPQKPSSTTQPLESVVSKPDQNLQKRSKTSNKELEKAAPKPKNQKGAVEQDTEQLVRTRSKLLGKSKPAKKSRKVKASQKSSVLKKGKSANRKASQQSDIKPSDRSTKEPSGQELSVDKQESVDNSTRAGQSKQTQSVPTVPILQQPESAGVNKSGHAALESSVQEPPAVDQKESQTSKQSITDASSTAGASDRGQDSAVRQKGLQTSKQSTKDPPTSDKGQQSSKGAKDASNISNRVVEMPKETVQLEPASKESQPIAATGQESAVRQKGSQTSKQSTADPPSITGVSDKGQQSSKAANDASSVSNRAAEMPKENVQLEPVPKESQPITDTGQESAVRQKESQTSKQSTADPPSSTGNSDKGQQSSKAASDASSISNRAVNTPKETVQLEPAPKESQPIADISNATASVVYNSSGGGASESAKAGMDGIQRESKSGGLQEQSEVSLATKAVMPVSTNEEVKGSLSQSSKAEATTEAISETGLTDGGEKQQKVVEDDQAKLTPSSPMALEAAKAESAKADNATEKSRKSANSGHDQETTLAAASVGDGAAKERHEPKGDHDSGSGKKGDAPQQNVPLELQSADKKKETKEDVVVDSTRESIESNKVDNTMLPAQLTVADATTKNAKVGGGDQVADKHGVAAGSSDSKENKGTSEIPDAVTESQQHETEALIDAVLDFGDTGASNNRGCETQPTGRETVVTGRAGGSDQKPEAENGGSMGIASSGTDGALESSLTADDGKKHGVAEAAEKTTPDGQSMKGTDANMLQNTEATDTTDQARGGDFSRKQDTQMWEMKQPDSEDGSRDKNLVEHEAPCEAYVDDAMNGFEAHGNASEMVDAILADMPQPDDEIAKIDHSRTGSNHVPIVTANEHTRGTESPPDIVRFGRPPAEIVEGRGVYSRYDLYSYWAHRSDIGPVSGNDSAGCDSILIHKTNELPLRRRDDLNQFKYRCSRRNGGGAIFTSYTKKLPFRVFYRTEYRPKPKDEYRYCGLYFVHAIFDNHGDPRDDVPLSSDDYYEFLLRRAPSIPNQAESSDFVNTRSTEEVWKFISRGIREVDKKPTPDSQLEEQNHVAAANGQNYNGPHNAPTSRLSRQQWQSAAATTGEE